MTPIIMPMLHLLFPHQIHPLLMITTQIQHFWYLGIIKSCPLSFRTCPTVPIINSKECIQNAKIHFWVCKKREEMETLWDNAIWFINIRGHPCRTSGRLGRERLQNTDLYRYLMTFSIIYAKTRGRGVC